MFNTIALSNLEMTPLLFQTIEAFRKLSLSISGIYFHWPPEFHILRVDVPKKVMSLVYFQGFTHFLQLAVGEKSGFGNFGYNFILPEVTTLP